MWNSTLSVGRNNGNVNEFKNQQIGILSVAALLDVRNCTFDKMIKINNPIQKTGIGILAIDGSNLWQSGKGISTTTFSNCELHCILAVGSMVNISNNRMSVDGQNGIRTMNGNANSSAIYWNKMILPASNINGLTCISVAKSNFGKDLIWLNDIETNGSGTGININAQNNSTGELLASANTIVTQNGWHVFDILPSGSDNITINGNTIRGSSQGYLTNLYYSSGENVSLEYNDFQAAGGAGINAVATPGVKICENIFDQSLRGLQFTDQSLDAVVRGNVFGDHQIGLALFGSMAAIGEQIHRGNRWTGVYSDKAARNGGDFPGISKFEVNANAGTGDPEYYPNSNGNPSVFPINDWFFKIAGNTNALCEIIPPLLSDWDLSILEGDFSELVDHHEVMIWNAERSLYRKLKNHPQLAANNTLVADFLQSKSGMPIDILQDVQELTRTAFTPATSIKAEWLELEAELKSHLEEFVALKDALEVTPENSQILSNLKQNVQEIEGLKNTQSALAEALTTNRLNKLAAAINLNNGIVSEKLYIQYEKWVNTIWLNQLLNETTELSSQELEDLKFIATQCPEIAGQSVYRAISLLPDCERKQYGMAAANCLPEHRVVTESVKNSEALPDSKISVYPNPADDQVQLIGLATEKYYRVEIYTTQGKLLISKQMKAHSMSYILDTQMLSSGIYLLKISAKNKVTENNLLYIQQ